LAHVDWMAEEAIDAVRHERHPWAGFDERRQRVAERPSREPVQHDASREEHEAGHAPARRPVDEEPLHGRPEEEDREESMMDAGHPERFSRHGTCLPRRPTPRPEPDQEGGEERSVGEEADPVPPSTPRHTGPTWRRRRRPCTVTTAPSSNRSSPSHTRTVPALKMLAKKASR